MAQTRIEPSDSNGYALWVRSSNSEKVWWKWYPSQGDAYTDAVQLGLATQEILGAQGFSATFRITLKSDADIDPDQLARFGLTLQSASD